MSFPVPLPYVLCLKCGPHIRSCPKATKDACYHPKVYFPDKKMYERYEAKRKKWKRTTKECDFSGEGVWKCFEDDWMD